MATASTIALDHQAQLIAISQTATSRSLNIWQQMNPDQLDDSWAGLAPALMTQVNAAQFAGVSTSNAYVTSLSDEYGFNADSGRINSRAFLGVDGSGRSNESLLHGAVTTTKTATGAGFGRTESFQAGSVFLAAMLKTVLADISRSSDLTAATGQGYTRYVRVINPGACSRCAILAGISSYKTAFRRHPACRCGTAPIVNLETGEAKVPEGLHRSADDYFESLSESEQNRVFTKGGAEAIRSGARAQDVVSARRGASGITTSRGIGRRTVPNSGRRITRDRIGKNLDGSPIMGYTTTEGTYRGAFRGRNRLMPETIISLTDDLPTRQILLRDAGYIQPTIADFTNSDWIRIQQAERAADSDAAQAFYRSLGITQG